MNIEFKRLTEVEASDIMELMNNTLVRRQMPLLKGDFTEQSCEKFVAGKEKLWNEHGYGPWAFVIDDTFAGWGGLQPEEGEADLALVLHPNFWGVGNSTLQNDYRPGAFGEMGLDSVVVFFPPSRTRIKGFLRLGFKKDKEVKVGSEQFIRFRLTNPALND